MRYRQGGQVNPGASAVIVFGQAQCGLVRHNVCLPLGGTAGSLAVVTLQRCSGRVVTLQCVLWNVSSINFSHKNVLDTVAR